MSLEPIAIVGIGCRFPGAKNPEAFWQLLCDGVEAISEVPNSRWQVEQFYDRDPSQPGKTHTRRGGFLEEIDRFEPQFFGIAPREANTMDPQQRLLLEVAWEALEDGGQIPEQLAGTRTGVFVGIGTHDYSIMLWQHPVSEPYATTGTGNCIAANRISYTFDFKGPSLAVDTACSSSLVAVHLACQSIWTGESTMALAGGVNILLLPTIMVGFSKGGFLSADGRCKSFDAAANGYVRSEGAGIVVLKPLSQAQADGDSIYALIRGSAVNQDGWTNGLAAPNPKAQEAVIKEACRKAGVSPGQIQYVEAHGTGTKLGDPVELQALGNALAEGRNGNFCALGSVKTNIGHAETAAGVAGLIKVALALRNGQIPPSLHFKKPNEAIAFEDLRLRVQTELTSWSMPGLAGVNSFGFGGTNAHVILAGVEASRVKRQKRRKGEQRGCELFVLSAKSEKALKDMAGRYVEFFERHGEIDLKDVCFTANSKRSQFNYRLAVVTRTIEQLRSQLMAFAAGEETAGLVSDRVTNNDGKIAFLFTGQGSQYVDMGRELYQTQPIFRAALDRCADILDTYLDTPLLQVIFAERKNSAALLNETVYTQPALFALEYALYKLWEHWGIKPTAVMGHSVGEYVAACVAGVFSLEDGLKLIAARGRLMQALPHNGAMVAVFASEEVVNNVIQPYQEKVAIAAINGFQNIVISGKNKAIAKIVVALNAQGIETKLLNVSHAFHSPLMEPILADFKKVARQINYSLPQIELVSNLTGKSVKEEIATPQYWCRHIRQPVRFADGIKVIAQKGYRVFLEVGAKSTLLGMGRSILENSDRCLWLPSLRQNYSNWQQFFQSLSELYVRGIQVNWVNNRAFFGKTVHLPTYPFQRQRFWWEGDGNEKVLEIKPQSPTSSHPLLGQQLNLAGTKEIRFQSEVSQDFPLYLKDHCVGDRSVFPATAYLEMALAAGAKIFQTSNLQIKNFAIAQPLILLKKESKLLQIVLAPQNKSSYRFQIFSNAIAQENLESSFLLHASGEVELGEIQTQGDRLDLNELKKEFQENSLVVSDYYQELKRKGLRYGLNFQGIKQLWQKRGQSLGKIELPETLIKSASIYQLHPVLLDSCLQLLGAALEDSDRNTNTYLPIGLKKLQVYQSAKSSLWSRVKVLESDRTNISTQQQLKAHLELFDELGNLVADLKGLFLQYVSHQSLTKIVSETKKEEQTNLESCLYEIVWQAKNNSERQTSNKHWLIFGDREGFGNNLAKLLEEKGDRTTLVYSDRITTEANDYIALTELENFQQLFAQINAFDGIIYLWCLSATKNLEEAQILGCGGVLNIVRTITERRSQPKPQLWIVTEKTQQLEANFSSLQIQQTALWGLARVIRLEHPDLLCKCVDIETREDDLFNLVREIQSSDLEEQIAYRQGVRYVPRLQHRTMRSQSQSPVRLNISEYGVLDNLTLVPAKRRPPAAGEVEIQVNAAGVNFRDVLNALGMLKEYLRQMGYTNASDIPFGGECAGRIVAIGEGVNWRVGNEVIAAQAVGSLSSYVTVDARFVVAKPKTMSFAEAATVPTTFLTAYYGLHYLAKIKKGERILIHSAAGGVGQAAIQIARNAGAEIFATASPKKWDFLKSQGVKHVMNSRTLDFAEEVMALTDGEGVDLVLNSLNGEFIDKNLEILAAKGRFVEIGKLGIWSENQIRTKRADIAYFPFDLLNVSQEKPDLITQMFGELIEEFRQGNLVPLPHKIFPIEAAANAFRYMAQAKHIGKVVISLPEIASQTALIKENGSYLVTGGLGSLGLQIARWLVEKGAKHLILTGRNQPSHAARETLEQLEQTGATFNIVCGDVSNLQDVEKLIYSNANPPLKGVIHAAGILDDGVLLKQTWERFKNVMTPKIQGAWNLHLATQNLPLDFFVCFSSIAALLGSPGQGNYAAANTFMDALVRDRRAKGLPGLSINWSIWANAGMAAELSAQHQDRLAQQGLSAIAPQQGLQILEELLQQQATQVGVLPVDWSLFQNKIPKSTFFADLLPQTTEKPLKKSESKDNIKGNRKTILFDRVRSLVAKVLGFDSPNSIDPQENFGDLGMDSLMAVELKNALQSSLGVSLPLTSAFDYPTVELLTEHLDKEISEIALTDEFESNEQLSRKKDLETAPTEEKNRPKKEILPQYYQFSLIPEYQTLRKDLDRVEKLGNPFFEIYDGVANNTIRSGDRELINYSSYNYLGMSGDPIISQAAIEAIARYGTSVSASRVVSGERIIHRELEREIADFLGVEDCIAYIGGHATNVTTIGHLFGKNDLIVCDELSHNSIREGCKLSGAEIIDFPHNDYKKLDCILAEHRDRYEKVLIAIEGIYSTDGDLAPLPEFIQIKKRHQTFILVDEAHSIGVLGDSGRGIGEFFGVKTTDVDLWMGTLSKSFASCGGYIAGCKEVVEYLKYTSPGFVFSVGMSPANTAAALAAIRLLKNEPQRVTCLRDRAKLFLELAKKQGLNTGNSQDSPIIPIIVGEPYKAVQLAQALNKLGINVQPMVYPSVPYNASRLRFFISSTHTEAQIHFTVEAIAQAIGDS
jgi:8-amino-7-oxononanoate synthase/malonyl CoA-acyl carrier protein transacylase